MFVQLFFKFIFLIKFKGFSQHIFLSLFYEYSSFSEK